MTVSPNSTSIAPQPRRRAALYCRVSTNGQEDGYSLDVQEQACREYATEQGLEVVAVYREVFSGAELYARPTLSECRTAMDQRLFDTLIVLDPDRFSRDQIHTALLLHICDQAGVELKFACFDFENDPTGRFLLSARAFAAELERLKIKERTMSGLVAKVRDGKLTGRGRAPYGYRYREQERRGTLELDPDTAPIVREMFALSAQGMTIRRIADLLTARGVQPPRGGARWAYTGVREILSNRAYIGEATALKTRSTKVRGKQVTRRLPAEEHKVIPCPPLVDRGTFDAVQRRLARNRAEAVRANRHPERYLLRAGYVFCGYCGKGLAASWERPNSRGERAPIYRTHHIRHTDCGTGRRSLTIRAAVLDAAAWAKVEEYLADPDKLGALLEGVEHELDLYKAPLADTERALAEVAKQQRVTADAVAVLDDSDSAAPLLEKLTSLAARRRALLRERDELMTKQVAQREAQDRRTGLIALWRNAAALDTASYEGKREALAALGIRALVYGRDKYRIIAPREVGARTAIASSSTTAPPMAPSPPPATLPKCAASPTGWWRAGRT